MLSAFETHDAILITDASANIVRVNQAFTHLTGYRADEVVGRNPSMIQSERQGGDFFKRILDTLLLSGNWQSEVWNKRKNGEEFPAWMNITAVVGKDGKVTLQAAGAGGKPDKGLWLNVFCPEDSCLWKGGTDLA